MICKEYKNSDIEIFEKTTSYKNQDNNCFYIKGDLYNKSNQNFGYVQITFDCFDENGNYIDSAIDVITNFISGNKCKFSAVCSKNVDKIYTYKLKEIYYN
ncbi:FxLYD domain-containing protein [Anaerofustis stercorihominis]|uniref:Uncharacterized protein n=1 Tax=Anaerofustis stercorihominis TaxID=214853 RepID=A0A3E3E1Y5_9FIRM|nr:FxLYD domain-containing protein [Anaerofustis stercorihominis]RGD75574.1 hypothetical protein DW687_04415 [Anaerofustis stercorihominis]